MKPKKDKVADYTWPASFFAVIFTFIYMNIIKVFVRPQPPVMTTIPPPSKPKTTKKLQRAFTTDDPRKPVKVRLPATPAVVESPSPSIPLLKFSIAVEKKPIIPAVVEKKAVTVSHPTQREDQSNILFQNISLTITINKIFQLLQNMKNLNDPKLPLPTLIHQLAFVYRFHVLILSLKVLMTDGAAREDFYRARSLLVHNTDNHLLNAEILTATQAALMNIDLSELNELNYLKQKLTGEKFSDAIKALPLYKALHDRPDIHPPLKQEQLASWLKTNIIPLLNAIQGYAHKKDFPIRQECLDACKLVSIIAGEFCPSPSRKYPAKPSAITPFVNLCHRNRTKFAHFALTSNINTDNDALIALGKTITKEKIKDEQLNNCLSPFGSKACHTPINRNNK